jgi:hypothetical protein
MELGRLLKPMMVPFMFGFRRFDTPDLACAIITRTASLRHSNRRKLPRSTIVSKKLT